MESTFINPVETGRVISDFGFMVVCSALYLVFSASVLFFFIKWFVRVVDNIIERQQRNLDEILQVQREIKTLLQRWTDA
jgi:hypothetical protein